MLYSHTAVTVFWGQKNLRLKQQEGPERRESTLGGGGEVIFADLYNNELLQCAFQSPWTVADLSSEGQGAIKNHSIQ